MPNTIVTPQHMIALEEILKYLHYNDNAEKVRRAQEVLMTLIELKLGGFWPPEYTSALAVVLSTALDPIQATSRVHIQLIGLDAFHTSRWLAIKNPVAFEPNCTQQQLMADLRAHHNDIASHLTTLH